MIGALIQQQWLPVFHQQLGRTKIVWKNASTELTLIAGH